MKFAQQTCKNILDSFQIFNPQFSSPYKNSKIMSKVHIWKL